MRWITNLILPLAIGCVVTPPAGVAAAATDVEEAVTWLEREAHRIIRASRRELADGTAVFPPQVGVGYDAFWLRDFEYTLEGAGAAYSDRELLDACRLFVRSIGPDGAGVDCIRFDGVPRYRPGADTMGTHPVADGGPFTVGVAWHTYQRTRSGPLLDDVLDPLVTCLEAVPRDRSNGLMWIDPAVDWDRCPYGFTDTVRKRGDEFFCSLLLVQASRQLADLLDAADRHDEAASWREDADRVSQRIRDVFWDEDMGLFRAATVTCREHDIWGSALAAFLGVATPEQTRRVASFFDTHYDELVQHGQIRHLPGGVFWEEAGPRGEYQNGGHWAVPTGWFAHTLDAVNPARADQVVLDLVAFCREHGACEWIHGDRHQLRDYLASAALPLDGFKAMLARRSRAAGR